jgi:NADH-quinone oxidoreductase subunit N
MLDLAQIYNGYYLEKSLLSIMPEAVLIVFAFLILLAGLFNNSSKNSVNSYYLALIGIAFSFLYLFMLSDHTIKGFYGSIVFDKFDVFLFTAILLSGFLTILMSKNYFDTRNVLIPEYYSLVLFSVSAMMLLVSSVNLIMIFLSIEFMSICAYILTGYLKGESRSTEAAMKYFVLGTFASAFLLFGSVFIYAATGHLSLYKIHSFMSRQNYKLLYHAYNVHTFLVIGLILLLVGLAFKMSLFPFHAWTPDSYDGAPTPVTNLMATGIKIAAFGVFIRVFTSIYDFNVFNFYNILWILAILTMTFGNFAALLQTDLKRLIAYSSIAQAGYILIGVIAGGYYGISGTLFYLLAYVFMTAGAFAIIIMFENLNLTSVDIKSYSGLGYKYPLAGAAFSFFLLSLAGIPVTAGFMGKFFVFSAAIKSGYYWLVVIALLNSAFAAYYYLKIIVKMYMSDNNNNGEQLNLSNLSNGSNNIIINAVNTNKDLQSYADNGSGKTALTEAVLLKSTTSALIIAVIICLIFTLILGIFPQPFISFASRSVTSLWSI